MSSKELFCAACREEVALKSVVELHIKNNKHTKKVGYQGQERTGHSQSFEHMIRKCILLV